jgi:hypothetical protein
MKRLRSDFLNGLLLVTLALVSTYPSSFAFAQETQPRGELTIALGPAFPQGDFTRNVSTGLDGQIRVGLHLRSVKGLTLIVGAIGADFAADDARVIVDTTGGTAVASQTTDFRVAGGHLGVQWAGPWTPGSIRPRFVLAPGLYLIESEATVRLVSESTDRISSSESESKFGIHAELGGDWMYRRSIGLNITLSSDQVFDVLQFEKATSSGEVKTTSKSVTYITLMFGATIPF